MTSPIETLERLQGLPEHLRPHNRRFIVEAITDETRAPFAMFYEQTHAAEKAASAWGKPHGAEAFYPPTTSTSTSPRSVFAFSFKNADFPGAPAWTKAGRGFVTRHGYTAAYPSKRPPGKALTAELASLPMFPGYGVAIDHLNRITDLNTAKGGGGVGCSDNKLHFTTPARIGDRYFVNVVNHNFDIARAAERAIEHLTGEHPEWAPDLGYVDDPISWRPGAGWAFLSSSEFALIIAQARVEASGKGVGA